MKRPHRAATSLSDDEMGILRATMRRQSMDAAEVFRHLLLYHGMVGGDMPLTRRIDNLPPEDRARVVAEIRRCAESGEPAKPQSFRTWIKEVLGKDDPATMERGADALLRQLLKG